MSVLFRSDQKLTVLLLLGGLLSFGSAPAQFIPFFESDEAYAKEIVATQNCIVTGNPECPHSFEQAIELALETENDSLIGHCYLWIALKGKGLGVPADIRANYLEDAMSRMKSSGNFCFQGMIYSQIAANAQDAGQTDYMAYHDSALIASEKCSDPFCVFQIHMGRAFSLEASGDISASIFELKKADAIAQSAGDTSSLAQVKYGLGGAYSSNDDQELAEQSYKRAAELSLINGDTAVHWLSQVAYCNALNEQEKPGEGLLLLPEAIDFFRSKGLVVVLPSALNELGHSYLISEQFDKTISTLTESEEIATQLGRTENLANTHHMLSEAYLRKGDEANALNYSSLAYESYSQQDRPARLMSSALTYAKSLKVSGRYEESVKVYEQYLTLKDSLFNESKMKEVSRLQTELEVEQRENELCAVENDLAVSEKENLKVRNRNYALMGALLLLGLLGYALISRQRLRTAEVRAKVREKEHENERLSQEVAFKNRELSAKVLNIAKKNEVLLRLQNDLEELARSKGEGHCVREVVSTLKLERTIDGNWDLFTKQFTELNPEFYQNLNSNYDGLTKSDLRLAALLRMNLSSKDIAHMLNISDDGVKKARQRIRKKLELEPTDSLEGLIMSI